MPPFFNRDATRLALLLGFLFVVLPSYAVDRVIWSKQATPLDTSCSEHARSIPSPDHQSSLDVLCLERQGEDPVYSLRIKTVSGQSYRLPLEQGANEALWAPNSRAFFVNGGTSAYSGFFVDLYTVGDSEPKKLEITNAAQRDMVAMFPPCKAENRDEADCARIAKGPEYNMSGVDWANDSSAVRVFAEVPCSGFYGGIMCQVRGYELSVPDGRIRKRLTAREMSTQWRRSMAWHMHIPEPPAYGPPLRRAAR